LQKALVVALAGLQLWFGHSTHKWGQQALGIHTNHAHTSGQVALAGQWLQLRKQFGVEHDHSGGAS